MQENLIPLNITIGDRNYRIKILSKDEEEVRKSLKIINEKILEFRGQFAGKDMQDYISMVLIWYATQPRDAMEGMAKEELIGSLTKLEDQLKQMEE